jgi:ATP-dependent RNA helicase UAP56/SUB2
VIRVYSPYYYFLSPTVRTGLAVSFISRPEDEEEMKKVQERFAVQVPEMPDQIDISTYM